MRSGIYAAITALLILCAPAFAYDWSTNPGNGTPENPYQISEPNHLIAIGADPNLLDNHFILTNDIIFDPNNNSNHVFDRALIAPDINSAVPGFQGIPFSGVFNGAHHTISWLTIDSGTEEYIGLFGKIHSQNQSMEVVRDLTISGFSIYTEGDYVGVLAGYLENGIMRNCTIKSVDLGGGASAGNIWGNDFTGGLVGYIQNGNIIHCRFDGEIYGSEQVGGIVGWIHTGLIDGCTSSGYVYGFNMIGGIAGRSGTGYSIATIEESGGSVEFHQGEILGSNDISIKQCQTDVYLNGDVSCGGFVGLHSWGNISRCFSNATVRGIEAFGGGFAGALIKCEIKNNYADIDLKGKLKTGGFCGMFYRSGLMNCYCAGIVEGEGLDLPDAFIAYSLEPETVESCYYSETLGYAYTPPYFGIRLSEEQMGRQASFTSWDFVGESDNGDNEIWRMCVDGVDYPRLSWEFAANGDFACGDGVDILDLESLAAAWLTAVEITPDTFNYAADANGDEQIDFKDYCILAENWLLP